MKTVTMIISVLVLVILSSCGQKTDPNAILENSETRMELFEAIASNHGYLTEFMDNMQDNDHAMQMMKGNHMGLMEENELDAKEQGELELSKSQSHGDHH